MGETYLNNIGSAVKAIKTVILKSRYVAAKAANAEMVKLYYAIGGYVSSNSRAGTWGTGVIEAISERLSREMPGLRGFSAANMKNMRIFFENWSATLNRQPVADEIRQPLTSKIQQTVSSDLPLTKVGDIVIRQSVIGDLGPSDAEEESPYA